MFLRAGYFGEEHRGVCFCCSGAGFANKDFSTLIEKDIDRKFRVCGKVVELVGNVASGCTCLAQRQY